MRIIEKTIKKATLVFLVRDNEILLARKVIDPIIHKPGAGKLNGFGGGFEESETLEQCCFRETMEESRVSIVPKSLELVAIVYFKNTKSDVSKFTCKVYCFFATEWFGNPRSGKEMIDPKWYKTSNMPWDDMIPGDKYWFEPVLSKMERILGYIEYGPFQREVIGKPIIKKVSTFVGHI